MKMEVETYLIEEVNSSEATIMAADATASELIQQLGLTGQQKLLNPATLTRNPFRRMTQEEMNVFEIIFPNKSALTDYTDGIIPIRVLEIAKQAIDSGFFQKLKVWHPPAGVRDPILVGYHEEPAYEGAAWMNSREYLLARWGEGLQPFDALKEKARKMLAVKWKIILNKTKREVDNALTDFDNVIEQHLSGQATKNDPSFSW